MICLFCVVHSADKLKKELALAGLKNMELEAEIKQLVEGMGLGGMTQEIRQLKAKLKMREGDHNRLQLLLGQREKSLQAFAAENKLLKTEAGLNSNRKILKREINPSVTFLRKTRVVGSRSRRVRASEGQASRRSPSHNFASRVTRTKA